MSPAATETEFEVSFPVVAVLEIVTARDVSAPFFLTVKVRELPEPGAVPSLI